MSILALHLPSWCFASPSRPLQGLAQHTGHVARQLPVFNSQSHRQGAKLVLPETWAALMRETHQVRTEFKLMLISALFQACTSIMTCFYNGKSVKVVACSYQLYPLSFAAPYGFYCMLETKVHRLGMSQVAPLVHQ